MSRFLALDFETASGLRYSACALGLCIVHDGHIVETKKYLIRPPEYPFFGDTCEDFEFKYTYIHGITWFDVEDKPDFEELWGEIEGHFKGINFIAAHNAAFDKSVLRSCCEYYGVDRPQIPFECTVKISREIFGIYPTKLHIVCEGLDIPLNHHDPSSDAEACAKIVIAAESVGWKSRWF